MGTAAVQNISLLKNVSNKYPNQISIGMDVRKGFLALKGWTDQTKLLASDFLAQVKDYKIKSIIFTDIDKDGTKEGVNLEETLKLTTLSKIPVIASGGLQKLKMCLQLKKLSKSKALLLVKQFMTVLLT